MHGYQQAADSAVIHNGWLCVISLAHMPHQMAGMCVLWACHTRCLKRDGVMFHSCNSEFSPTLLLPWQVRFDCYHLAKGATWPPMEQEPPRRNAQGGIEILQPDHLQKGTWNLTRASSADKAFSHASYSAQVSGMLYIESDRQCVWKFMSTISPSGRGDRNALVVELSVLSRWAFSLLCFVLHILTLPQQPCLLVIWAREIRTVVAPV